MTKHHSTSSLKTPAKGKETRVGEQTDRSTLKICILYKYVVLVDLKRTFFGRHQAHTDNLSMTATRDLEMQEICGVTA